MYKVLIAEDEMMFRMMLKSSINWNRLNMAVAADVSNGEEGWRAYRDVKPDIVVTDLRMPVMDGLDLIAKIRASDTQAKIIVLTCMDDFEMVRTALKLGVSDYILKLTMTPDEMDAILGRVARELETEGRAQPAEERTEWDRDAQKERLIKNYLFRKKYGIREFAARVEELRLRIEPSRGIAGVMMEIDHFERLRQRFGDPEGQIVQMSILNVLEEILSGFRFGEAVSVSESRYLILANCVRTEDLLPLAEHIRKVMKTYFNRTVTFGVSRLHSGFEALHAVYSECLATLERKFFLGLGVCHVYAAEGSDDDPLPVILLNGGDRVWLTPESRQTRLYDKLRQIGGNRPDDRQQVIWLFVQGLNRLTNALRLTGEEVSKRVFQYAESISRSETLEEAIESFEAFAEDALRLQSQNRMSKEVSRVMEWIEERYMDNLDLQQAADKANMSYNYLSTLFKKEAGVSFSDYLQQVRIEKAKELLLKTDKRLYDIMEEVGIADQSYFSQLFKKLVGVRPTQFKKTWVQEREAEELK